MRADRVPYLLVLQYGSWELSDRLKSAIGHLDPLGAAVCDVLGQVTVSIEEAKLMVEFVSVSECESNFGRLLDRVRLGDRFIITENGKPIAELRPVRTTAETRLQFVEKHQQPAEPQSPA